MYNDQTDLDAFLGKPGSENVSEQFASVIAFGFYSQTILFTFCIIKSIMSGGWDWREVWGFYGSFQHFCKDYAAYPDFNARYLQILPRRLSLLRRLRFILFDNNWWNQHHRQSVGSILDEIGGQLLQNLLDDLVCAPLCVTLHQQHSPMCWNHACCHHNIKYWRILLEDGFVHWGDEEGSREVEKSWSWWERPRLKCREWCA